MIQLMQFLTEETLKNKLAAWVVKNRCRRDAANELLQILNEHGHNLPKDSLTLLKIPRHLTTQMKCSGQYIYFGIEAGIVQILSSKYSAVTNLTTIDLIVNIDGLPLKEKDSIWSTYCCFAKCEVMQKEKQKDKSSGREITSSAFPMSEACEFI